ncbi:hypothetical protein O6H91_07G096700 [Diphasiastrum complanatum]|uniref:Uncharacterized protein n=1 Tax=Diphasiastrum complanatum TaxID=34168 RepID=A0ACC2D7Y9_DIPCM|nr:hypothetical protein O6H91_Y368800 [Diphasiastrum complanatum]KAJ7550356.1 hypothetical protein O6H91_07G096700 [Diphasiastrum complanatum]
MTSLLTFSTPKPSTIDICCFCTLSSNTNVRCLDERTSNCCHASDSPWAYTIQHWWLLKSTSTNISQTPTNLPILSNGGRPVNAIVATVAYMLIRGAPSPSHWCGQLYIRTSKDEYYLQRICLRSMANFDLVMLNWQSLPENVTFKRVPGRH